MHDRSEPVTKQVASTKAVALGLLVVALAVGASTLAWWRLRPNDHQIPQAISSGVSFPLYYPQNLPAGYVADKTSFRIDGGIVFFTVTNADSSLYITEQLLPKNKPDLKYLENTLGFKRIDSKAGSAVLGMNGDQPTAIVITNTSLVTIHATKNTPDDVLVDFVNNLHSL